MSLEVNISEPDDFDFRELHSSIEEVVQNKGYGDFEYNVDSISGKGSFTANVFRVLIKPVDCNEVNFSVIVKTLINTERQYLFHELHKREVIAYTKVINKFIFLQNILEVEEKLVLPECLLINTDKNNEIIILNDLKNQGFELDEKQARFEHLSFDQVNSVVGELAKFHALSFLLQKQEPEKFHEITSQFHDILFQNSFLNKSKLRNYFFESFDMFLEQIIDKEAKNKLVKIRDSLLELLQGYTKPGKINVLCHGDCWMNNMLFKYENDHRAKICFIDFQAMRYANPMTDFMFFIFLSTDSKFRTEYFDTLKNTYYDSLKLFLDKFKIDINSMYTKKAFDTDLEDFLPYGLLVAVIELRIVTISIEEYTTIEEEAKLVSNWDLSQIPHESDLFRYRVNDVVQEAVQNGVLDKLLAKIV